MRWPWEKKKTKRRKLTQRKAARPTAPTQEPDLSESIQAAADAAMEHVIRKELMPLVVQHTEVCKPAVKEAERLIRKTGGRPLQEMETHKQIAALCAEISRMCGMLAAELRRL